MKTVVVLAVLAIATQAYGQCIPPCHTPACPPNCGCSCPAPAIIAAPAPCLPNCGCSCPAPAIIAAPAPCLPNCECCYPSPAIIAAPAPTVVTTNSVAANLADTLSLLTVTSLLAETLPYGCPPVCACPIGYPGCGCVPGCGGYSYIL